MPIGSSPLRRRSDTNVVEPSDARRRDGIEAESSCHITGSNSDGTMRISLPFCVTAVMPQRDVYKRQGYSLEMITKAIRLVNNGAKLIGTNYDLTGPTEDGIAPACRALLAPIELTTGKQAYYVGKPNPLMMRTGLKLLGVHSEEAAIIGDRMDTDIIAGIESGLDTVLVLSGVTSREDLSLIHISSSPSLPSFC